MTIEDKNTYYIITNGVLRVKGRTLDEAILKYKLITEINWN